MVCAVCVLFFFFNDTATTEIYTLSLHDALPIYSSYFSTSSPKPAVILGFPVGFVGAAESKAELVRDARGCEYVALRGRRGGSAMASAAVNGLAAGLPEDA